MIEIQTVAQTVITVVFGAIILALVGLFLGLIYKGIDRKISAHMQGRIGPPIVQPFRDIRKLFIKENIIPENAIPWVFNLAPIIGLIGAISIMFYIPLIPQIDGVGLAPLIPYGGDLILILYLLMIPSLAMVVGGFASGSPYATVGAQREMTTMIAYEFPLAIIIITIAWRISNTLIDNSTGLITNNGFSMSIIASTPIWNIVGPLGFFGCIILLLVLLIVTPAELSKIPFDSPEAETEIAGGLLTEYSGRNLGIFYLTDAVKTLVMGTIIVAIFFPFNLSPLLNITGYPGIIIDIIFFLIKLFLVILFSVSLIRVAVARLKIDQIVYTYWIPLTLLSLVGLILIMWDGQFGLPTISSLLGI